MRFENYIIVQSNLEVIFLCCYIIPDGMVGKKVHKL